jgi:hypothetical protein
MLRQEIAGQTLLISLSSWRYILTVSLIAYLFCAVLLLCRASVWGCAVSLAAGLVTLYYCWRLWMDYHFFQLLYRDKADIAAFDQAIDALWSKNSAVRSLAARWTATSKLIVRAWQWAALQWLGVIVSVISIAV